MHIQGGFGSDRSSVNVIVWALFLSGTTAYPSAGQPQTPSTPATPFAFHEEVMGEMSPGSEYKKGGSGGTLDFRNGLQLRWRCTNFWGSQYAFVGGDDRALVRFGHHEGFFKASARLEVDPSSAEIAELPLLVALGWYLMILAAEDAAAVAASTAVIA